VIRKWFKNFIFSIKSLSETQSAPYLYQVVFVNDGNCFLFNELKQLFKVGVVSVIYLLYSVFELQQKERYKQ